MNALLSFVPWYIRWLGVIALVLAASVTSAIYAARYEQGRAAVFELKTEQARARQLESIHQGNDREVTGYVADIEALGNMVPVARAGLDRMCNPGAGSDVHGVGGPDAAAAADAGNRPGDLAADLIACESNAAQLRRLQAELRPQLGHP
jgi:hypothetical protein